MALVASEVVQLEEVRERVERLRGLFLSDPEVARIDYRIGEDWSGDLSVFLEVVLRSAKPPFEVARRLSRELGDALLQDVRSEELGLHSYFNFVSNSGS
jgi:hypothetical protein